MINQIDNFLISGIEISPIVGLLIIICYICYIVGLWKKTQPPIFFLLFFIMWGCIFMGVGLAGITESFLFGLIFCLCAIFVPILFMLVGKDVNFSKKKYKLTNYEKDLNDTKEDSDKEDDWINVID